MNFMNIQHSTFNLQPRMCGRWLVRSMLGVFAIGTVLAASSGAEQTNSFPPRDSFSVIERNNIFNPNRRPEFVHQTNRNNVTPRTTQAFALVGTQLYSKGKFAFFNGSDSQFQKVLEPGGIIAGYTVKDVTLTNVTLSANGKDFSMPMGAQMRNQGENKWQLSGHIIEEPAATDETNGETPAAATTTAPTGANAAANDVLKQMMERRQQELSK
jgi:hypothetical protein